MTDKTKCIEWPYRRNKKGYGQVRSDGKMRLAHRVALEKRLGRKLLRDELVLHSCHNPPCINPAHLRIGTVAENNRDAVARKKTALRWLEEAVSNAD